MKECRGVLPLERIAIRPNVKGLCFALLLLALLSAGCSGDSALAVYLEANRSQLSRPAGTDPASLTFVVPRGATGKSIAQELQTAGLISDALLFEAYVREGGLAGQLQAGEYSLRRTMTIPQIAAELLHAEAPSVAVTVRPGWRLEQTADMLTQQGVLDGAEYRRMAQAVDLSTLPVEVRQSYSFLQFLPAGQGLEGYLYPDTYQIPRDGATAADLLRRQLDEFERVVMPAYWDATARQGAAVRDLHQVLIVASIVEREAVLEEERPLIAGVYLNRLAQGMRLEADPTVQYAMGFQPESGQWWKTPVYLEEYASVIGPYNTYLNAGLPPGPIAAPRLSSILAVLYPAEHDYLYFVAEPGGSGRHTFSRTFEEHLQAVERYRNGQ